MIDSPHDSAALRAMFRTRTKTSPTTQRRAARALLRRLERLMPLAGISRLADISWMSPAGLPAYQVSRPDIYSHVFFGQNTGSQGRGHDSTAARIGAIMEELEAYSAEPRNVRMLRGSYEFLQRIHPIIAPSAFVAGEGCVPASSSEPLMWTKALCFENGLDVLAPAETVFLPFFPAQYETRSAFPWNSTGLGAGRSLIEAALHGIYEVVERHFRALLEAASHRLDVCRLQNASLHEVRGFSALATALSDLEPFVLSLELKEAPPGLSMIVCALVDAHGESYLGYGCNLRALNAVESAVSEALQAVAVNWSATREDLAVRRHASPKKRQLRAFRSHLPSETVNLQDLVSSTQKLATLQQEFRCMADWVHQLGFPHILLKNLTRVGLELPVVRVIVPGVRHPAGWSKGGNIATDRDLIRCRYALSTVRSRGTRTTTIRL